MLRVAVVALVLTLAGAAVEAGPLRYLQHRGGSPAGGGGGAASACDTNPTNVCAQFRSGQTLVTWPDVATGSAGNGYRYSIYASTSPITAGNVGGLTPFATGVLNNSGQLYGGKVDSGGSQFSQTIRQDATVPMSVLTDLGTPLSYGTGLQAHTASGTQDTYFAVVADTCTDSNCNAFSAHTFIGSVGPIAESVGTPMPVKWADSNSRVSGISGKITGLTGLPLILSAHQSTSTGGCPGAANCAFGDYWEFFLPAGDGNFQDGRASAFDVQQDNAFSFPSYGHALVLYDKDSQWAPGTGNSALESYHSGLGMTPNPSEGPANRIYLGTAQMIRREIQFAQSHYSTDPESTYWSGASMGAWGGANTGMRLTDPNDPTKPQFAAVFLSIPMWRKDFYGDIRGNGWISTMPFYASSFSSPYSLYDGSCWDGTGCYADMPSFIASNPGTDLPFAIWQASKNDPFTTNFVDQINARNAFETAHRGYAACWFMGAHDTLFTARGVIDADWTGHDDAVAYRKDKLKRNLPYPAFANSSINDNPGTGGTLANGSKDGDWSGCWNAGFTWSFSSDTAGGVAFTVGNPWMARSPTVHPQTTTNGGTLGPSGTGTLTFASDPGFQTVSGSFGNVYFMIGGTEIVSVSAKTSTSVTVSGRGLLGTTAQAHSVGETVQQIITQATGPNGGPYSTMTVDITPRRLQGFTPANGATVTCVVTPDGGGPTTRTPTVADGLFTLTGVTINATGPTVVTCS